MVNLYTEVAVTAAPVIPPTLYEIPRKNGSIDDKALSRRGKPHYRDEEDYQTYHLSSNGGVHFRDKPDVTPRSCLWTVSGESRVLQVQPADLARNERDTKEAYLTLQFAFQDPIREHAIDLSDSEHDDSLHIFVATIKEEVYHLAIPPSAFKVQEALDNEISQWCYSIDASSLSIDSVFRLRAQSPFELFICYSSGNIQRLQRKADTRRWDATLFKGGPWNPLSRFTGGGSRKIEYGSSTVDSRAAQSMQASPDSAYLYTVCLNHQLRIWHLPTGKTIVEKDLLDLQGDAQERTLSAFDRGHLQYLHGGPDMRNSMLVTFSPREGGQFKFWDVKGGLTDELTVHDRYPGAKLTPPDPDPTGNTVWSLVSFRLVPQGELDARGSAQLWVLWRNNNHHKLFSVHFDFDNIERGWEEHNWVSATNSRISQIPDVLGSGCEDATSQWLEYLFLPGRYPTEVLETALSVYTSSTNPSLHRTAPLKVRIAAAIAPNNYPKKQEPDGMNFDLFAWEIDQAWRSFHRAVEKINDARQAPLTLAYDTSSDLPIIVMTGQMVVLRECDRLELVARNESSGLDQLERICPTRWPHRQVVPEERGITYESLAQLLFSNASFVDEFPSELVQDLKIAIADMMFVMQDKPTPTKIHEMYDEVNFAEAVSNDTFDRLETNLTNLGGFQAFTNELILGVIDLLPEPSPRNKHDVSLASTVFGLKVLSAAMHDYLSLTRDVLWNLLVLVSFMEGEFCSDGDSIPGFDAAELFSTIVPMLKTVQRNIWLAEHSRKAPLSPSNPQTQPAEHQMVSLLEDRFLKAVQPRSDGSKPRSYLLTALVHEADEFSSRDDPGYDNGTVMLQCNMLQHGEVDLATEFSRFIPVSPWATYIKGRLALVKQQYDQAEQYFRQAAYRLACGRALGDLHQLSFGFITPLEVDSFNNGLPRYFQHILNLFDAAKAYAQSAHFAQLALQALTPDQKSASSAFRSELLSRLFTAQIQLSRYRAAFVTLAQFSDAALQKNSTSLLITAVLDPEKNIMSITDSVAALQSMPWSLYPHLARQLDAQLSTFAKKQKTVAADGKRFHTPDAGVDYLKIVHAMRLTQGDYRGAVTALYDRLRLVQRQGRLRADPQATVMRHSLLGLINVMACMPADEAYILAEADEDIDDKGPAKRGNDGDRDAESGRRKKRRRIIITLADLRKEYQRVLDRCARVERGDFGFSDGEDSGDEEFADGGKDTTRLELTILDGGRDRGSDGGVLAF